MERDEESGSPSWSALYIKETTEDVARVVAAAASAAVPSPRSPRPSVVYSSKDDCGSPLNRLQNRVSRILKGLSTPPEVKSGPYNPEVLTSLKRQWAANFQLQSVDHRVQKEQSKIFESMVILGLPPCSDIAALQNLYFKSKVEGSGIFRSAQQARVEPNLEPQVLFVYPPEKQLPLKYKELLSFCFPAGVEVNAVEKTPSMSELNEILLGQEHLKQSDQSFVFRLQVADESTLYGCCVMVEEIIHKPSGLISLMSDDQPVSLTLSRHILTTRRCYCILSRVPSFELHFGVLNSIFTEERLERLTKQVNFFESPESFDIDENLEEETAGSHLEGELVILKNGTMESSQVNISGSVSVPVTDDTSHVDNQKLSGNICSEEEPNCNAVQVGPETEKVNSHEESTFDTSTKENANNQLAGELVILKNGTVGSPQLSTSDSISVPVIDDTSHVENQILSGNSCSEEEPDVQAGPETEKVTSHEEFTIDTFTKESSADNQLAGELVILKNGTIESPQVRTIDSISVAVIDDTSHVDNQMLSGNNCSEEVPSCNDVQVGSETAKVTSHQESTIDTSTKENRANNQLAGLVILNNGTVESPEVSTIDSISVPVIDDTSRVENQNLYGSICSEKESNCYAVQVGPESEKVTSRVESTIDASTKENNANDQIADHHLPNGCLPLLRYQPGESSESSSSFQGSPSEDRRFRSDVDEPETEETSSSGRDIFSEQGDIFEWAKVNNHGSLQIICEYYRLTCPARGSTIKFHPLDHLHPLEYQRPDETILRIAGSTIDLRSCNTSLEFTEAHNALTVEEEAAALSVWAIACLCGSLRLEHVLTLFTGVLLEKQIVVVCSNLGILSAIVLSIIPLIRPYQWQSLLMPVLPSDMLDFLDAPVPYIAGVKNKTSEVQSKLTNNYILVDANRNQVKSPSLPHLPQYRELHSCLIPYHAKLVGESYLGKKRPVYEYTDAQVEAAKGFLGVLRSYLDSLCSNLRSHTITNVQSNDDKVSLLLKESFIESFPNRDRPFIKQFLDTQLFSVHTDFVLSFFQKE